MNRPLSLRLLCGSVSCLLLAACVAPGPSVSPPPDPQPGRILVDPDYVGAVERRAFVRGVKVQWVNPPTRRVPDDR